MHGRENTCVSFFPPGSEDEALERLSPPVTRRVMRTDETRQEQEGLEGKL